MKSGWVRIQAPNGFTIQVNLVPLGGGGGNLFSAWITDGGTGADTVFYAINHTNQPAQVKHKWNGPDGEPLQDTFTDVPAFGMRQIPASAYTG